MRKLVNKITRGRELRTIRRGEPKLLHMIAHLVAVLDRLPEKTMRLLAAAALEAVNVSASMTIRVSDKARETRHIRL